MTDVNPSTTPTVVPTPAPDTPTVTPTPAPAAPTVTPAPAPDPSPAPAPAAPLPTLYMQVLARFKGPLTLVNALNLVTVSIEVAESTNLPGATKKQLVIDVVNGFVDRSSLPDAEKALLKASLAVLLPATIDSLVDVANKALGSSCC
jgi:hypothetical protein